MTQSKLLEVARSYREAGRRTAAEAIYRRIADEQPGLRAGALHALGVLALDHDEPQVAASWFAQAIQVNGSVPEYHVDLSRALEGLADLTGAIAAAERAVTLGPRSPALLGRLFALDLLADRPGDAVLLVGRMVSDPGIAPAFDADVSARAERGAMRRAIGDHSGARNDLRAALAAEPSLALGWSELGKLARAANDDATAIACLGRAVEPDADVVHDRGVTLQRMGRLEEARSHFKEVSYARPYAMCRSADIGVDLSDLDISPERAEAVRQRGLKSEALGRDGEAVALFALASSLAPNDARGREDLDRILARFGKRRVSFYFLFHSSMLLAVEPDMFVRRAQLGQIPDDLLVIFLSGTHPANRTMLSLWERHLPLVADDRLYYSMLETLLPGLRASTGFLYENLYENYAHPTSRSVLSFTPEEMERGRAGLRRLGIDPDKDWFACVFARDNGWATRIFAGLTDTYTDFRNADINTYRPAIRRIVERGGTVVRIGAGAQRPLDMAHPKVIDYSRIARDDFMDIFLVAHCRFLMGTPAGILDVGKLFDRPCLYVNTLTIGHCPPGKQALHLPKRLARTATGEPVPIAEYFGHFLHATDPVAEIYTDAGLARNGYTYVDNTPEEILEAAEEMLDLLEGRWGKDPTDQALLERYFALFGSIPHPQIGSPARARQPMVLSHLRRYRSWYFPDG